MLQIRFGDVIKAWNEYDGLAILVHGCNCWNRMGAGIAATISHLFPTVYKKDKETRAGDKSKLGTINFVEINPGKFIVNAYTQFNLGQDLKISALKLCMDKIQTQFPTYKVFMPAIGMGIAGGKPSTILPIINDKIIDAEMYLLNKEMYNKFKGIMKNV